MKVLIAEDEAVSRLILETALRQWGYEVVLACDGKEAWNILQGEHAPQMAIIDWVMPGMDGVEICRIVRRSQRLDPPYLVLLTVKDNKKDIVAGLHAGANDYISKPFNHAELCARMEVGKRIIELQSELAARIKELEDAMAHIKTLQGILPICSYCKKIRTDENYWQKLESYFAAHSSVRFSHGACPECYDKYIAPQLRALDPARYKNRPGSPE